MSKGIVLIHGWACDENIWQHTKKVLTSKQRIYTLNLPPMKDLFTYRDAVVALIEEQCLEQVVLLGWSLGSMVAMQVASQLPHKIKGLVLVSGTARFISDLCLDSDDATSLEQSGIPPVLVTRIKKRLAANREKTIHDFYQLMFSTTEREQGLDRKIIIHHLNKGRRWCLQEAQGGLDYLMTADVRIQLPNITCPTLLLHGALDKICPLAGARYIKQQVPQGQLIAYQGVGHIPFLTNPVAFHFHLEEWLANL